MILSQSHTPFNLRIVHYGGKIFFYIYFDRFCLIRFFLLAMVYCIQPKSSCHKRICKRLFVLVVNPQSNNFWLKLKQIKAVLGNISKTSF